MTVLPDQPSKWPLGSKDKSDGVNPEEPPPSYSSKTDSIDSEVSGSVPSSSSRPFKTKPTNFLALSNENSIEGEFVIDPSLRIPSSLLPPLGNDETEEDRKNLSLRSKYRSVHAKIWLLGSSRDGMIDAHKPRRTTIELVSEYGFIHTQVQTLDGPVPFSLTASASSEIRLAIPRSFQGLLSMSARCGSISVSDPIIEKATQLSQLGATQRYFIGDFDFLGEDEWRGDQVEIDSVHGSVCVKYVDEVTEAQGKNPGLLGWLFRK